jgi:outer membrane protein assembly factor BamB
LNSVVNTLQRRTSRVALIGLLLVVLVSACGPVHTEPRWASISAVAGGSQILLAFGDRLSLVNAEDGDPVPLLDSDGDARLDDQGNARVWEVRGTGEGQTRFYSNPIFLDAETLLAASYDQKLVEIDFPVARVDGDAAATTQHIVASPVRDGDLIYVGLSDHDLVAYDAADLTEAWRIVTEHGVWSEPIVVEDVIYFTSMDHFLYAANKNSGELLWKTDLQGAMTAAPVYADGHLYVGTFANKIFDVNAETGEILSEFPISGWIWNPPTLVDGTLYVTDLSGTVYALNTVDGDLSQVWQVRVSEKALPPSPLVTEDFVIVGSRDHNVYWLNRADGSVEETRAVAGEVLANLLLVEPSETLDISEPLVVVSTASPDELLVAFRLSNAERAWAYKR